MLFPRHLPDQLAEEAFGASMPVNVSRVEQVRTQLIGGFQAAHWESASEAVDHPIGSPRF